MDLSITEEIARFEEQYQYGCLSDIAFAETVVAVLPDAADDAARHPAWLTGLATEVAQLNAQWRQVQISQHAIPFRGGAVLPSRWLAAACCGYSVVGIPLFALFFWPALATMSDRFWNAGWQAWVALATFLLIPTVLFPGLIYWWTIPFERAEADFLKRRAAVILEALHRRREGSEPGVPSDTAGK